MLIDWFTVAAQALNFLILVWLMKRFLYQPILDAIAARERLIAGELADAAAKKAEATNEREEFEHKNQEFDRQRAGLMGKATDAAALERKRLIDEARTAADAMAAKRQQVLGNDARHLDQAIARRTQQDVFAIARKALADLASVRLEASMGDLFVARLRALAGQSKDVVAKALSTLSGPAIVRSAFDLPPEQRQAIQQAVNDVSAAEVQLRFETAPEVIGGIELTANGQKVTWSISGYLGSLEKTVGDLVNAGDARGVAVVAEPDIAAAGEPATGPAPVTDAPTPEPTHP